MKHAKYVAITHSTEFRKAISLYLTTILLLSCMVGCSSENELQETNVQSSDVTRPTIQSVSADSASSNSEDAVSDDFARTQISLAPYLEALGVYVEDLSFPVSQKFIDSQQAVYILGRTGTITYHLSNPQITTLDLCRWCDNSPAQQNDFIEFTNALTQYYGCEPVVNKTSPKQIHMWFDSNYSSNAYAWYEDTTIHMEWELVDTPKQTDNAKTSNYSTTEPYVETSEPEFVRLPQDNAFKLMNEELDVCSSMVDDITDIVDYWKTHNYTTANEIKAYEAMWMELEEKASLCEQRLTTNRPPEVFDSNWLEIRDCVREIAALCVKGQQMDTNNDGKYSRDEIRDLIQETGLDILDQIDKIVVIVDKMNAISNTEQSAHSETTPTKKSSESSEAKHYCEASGCYSEATYSIIGFSGKPEYYCSKHMEKMEENLDIIEDILDSGSSGFTNKYGTPTTKCAHPGCSNKIASSGNTNCCTKHSNRCGSCGIYIDEDALFCIACLTRALYG